MSKESAAGYRANLLTPRSTRAISPLDKKTTHSCTKTTYFRQKQSSKATPRSAKTCRFWRTGETVTTPKKNFPIIFPPT